MHDGNRKCAKCGAVVSENPSLNFHSFPRAGKSANIARVKIWAEYCFPGEKFTVDQLKGFHNSHKLLCSKHFDRSAYANDSMKSLNRNAVPSMPKTTSPVPGPLRYGAVEEQDAFEEQNAFEKQDTFEEQDAVEEQNVVEETAAVVSCPKRPVYQITISVSKLNKNLDQQAKPITLSVTESNVEALHDRVKSLTQENVLLKEKIAMLEQKNNILESQKRNTT